MLLPLTFAIPFCSPRMRLRSTTCPGADSSSAWEQAAEWVDAFYEEGAEGLVVVAASDVGVRVTERRLKRSADLIVERVVPEDGSLEGEPQVITVGDLPALRFSARIPDLEGRWARTWSSRVGSPRCF